MPLSDKDIKSLDLGNGIGLPAGFQGDRLDAFRLGASSAIEAMKNKVSLDAEKKKEGKA